MIYYLVVIFGVLACSVSQLLLKKSAVVEYNSAIGMMLNWRVLVSYCVMFITLLANIFAMKHGVMLKDMPILEALGYIFVPLLSWIILSEKTTKYTIIAIFFIVIGVIVFYA